MSKSKQDDAEAKNAGPEKRAATPDLLKPVKPKVGESEGNLREREEWFRKRSGSDQKAG